MPQLDVSTFCSQIFWILIGFVAIYVFVSNVAAARIEETLDNRNTYIDDLSKKTQELNSEAKRLEHESFVALENAEIESADSESRLIASFREQSIKEKNMLYDEFVAKARMESAKLRDTVDVSFDTISRDMADIVNMAMKSISCTSISKNGRSLQ